MRGISHKAEEGEREGGGEKWERNRRKRKWGGNGHLERQARLVGLIIALLEG